MAPCHSELKPLITVACMSRLPVSFPSSSHSSPRSLNSSRPGFRFLQKQHLLLFPQGLCILDPSPGSALLLGISVAHCLLHFIRAFAPTSPSWWGCPCCFGEARWYSNRRLLSSPEWLRDPWGTHLSDVYCLPPPPLKCVYKFHEGKGLGLLFFSHLLYTVCID